LTKEEQRAIAGGHVGAEDGLTCCEYRVEFHPECFGDPNCNIYQQGECIQYEAFVEAGCSITAGF